MTDMPDQPPKRKYTWLWVIGGIFVFFCIAGIGMAVFTAYWLGNHVEIVETPPADATKSFDEVRAKFPGQQPLIDFASGEPRATAIPAGAASTVKLTTLHIIAFDEDEGRMVRVDVPFWVLRMKSGPIAFSSYASGFDDERVRLRVEDIERRGPGIVLDVSEGREGRVLIWAE